MFDTQIDGIRYLIAQTFKQWREDKASRLAAALSYYTIFSLPPLLILSLAIAGIFYNQSAAQEEILVQATAFFGETGARAIAQVLENAGDPTSGSIASIFSIILLLFGASGVFGQLQDALNTIWEVKPRPGRGIKGAIRDRLFAIALVLTVGFLLLISLILTAVLETASDYLIELDPGAIWLARIFTSIISFGAVSLMFAMVFKLIPGVKIDWRDVWLGAVVTALLFNVGKWAIGIYLRKSAPSSAYGAAGSLIVLLIWIYYTAQILFMGAEFTQVFANRYGHKIVPADSAILTADDINPQATAKVSDGE